MDPQPHPLSDDAATVRPIFADLTSEMSAHLNILDRRPRCENRNYSVMGTFYAPNQPILRMPGAKKKRIESG